jgi:hypothetical protein
MDAIALRSLLLRLVLVVAVLAGLLAMHTVITGAQHTAAVAPAAVEHHPAETAHVLTEPAVPDDCASSGCLPLHAMGIMTCLLALLVAWALSGAAPPTGRWMRELRAAALALVAASRSVLPPPPSLVALSISRT